MIEPWSYAVTVSDTATRQRFTVVVALTGDERADCLMTELDRPGHASGGRNGLIARGYAYRRAAFRVQAIPTERINLENITSLDPLKTVH